MGDKYDDAVAYLTDNPGEILAAWNRPDKHPAGALFNYVAREVPKELDCMYGCLTQIRGEIYEAETPELTRAIRADERIPRKSALVTLAHLPVFAEWQRRIDKELNRV